MTIHVVTSGKISFFLWLSLFTFMFTFTDHILFIHLSIDGHFGHFPVIAIVNSAALNIEVHVSCGIVALSG